MKRILLVLTFTCLSFVSWAQTYGNFRQLRFFPVTIASDTAATVSNDGRMWYDLSTDQFRVIKNGTVSSLGAGGSGSGAVNSVTGDGVNNADPTNPVMNLTSSRVLTTNGDTDQTDNLHVIYLNSGSNFNLTIDALTTGTQINLINKGTGSVTFVAGVGVTIDPSSSTTIDGGETGLIIYETSTAPRIFVGDIIGVATPSVSGTTKLYTTTGVNTDGAMNQNATTTSLAAKQDVLVSGTNIKTISSTSLLGSGDIPAWLGSSGVAMTANNTISGSFDIGFTNDQFGVGVVPASITSGTKFEVRGIGATNSTVGFRVMTNTGTNNFWVDDLGTSRMQVTAAPTTALEILRAGVSGMTITGGGDITSFAAGLGVLNGTTLQLKANSAATTIKNAGDNNGSDLNVRAGGNSGTSIYSDLIFQTGGNSTVKNIGTWDGALGGLSIGTQAPTASLHIKAGTTTASTGQIKLEDGVDLTTPENGVINRVGGNLNFTTGGVVRTLVQSVQGAFSTNLVPFVNDAAGILSAESAFNYNPSTNAFTVDAGSLNASGTGGLILSGTGYIYGSSGTGVGTNNYSIQPSNSATNSSLIIYSKGSGDLTFQNQTSGASGWDDTYFSMSESGTDLLFGLASTQTAAKNLVVTSTGGNATIVNGGNTSLTAGSAYSVSGNGNGGDVNITSGLRRTAGSGVDGNLVIETRNATGTIKINDGANEQMGVATLVGGTLTVNNTKVTANTRITLTIQSLGTVTVPTTVGITARVAGTSFTITSANVVDTSVIFWQLWEPN